MDESSHGAFEEGQSDGEDMDLIEQALAELDMEDAAQSHGVTEDGAKEILMTLTRQKVNKLVTMSTVRCSSRSAKWNIAKKLPDKLSIGYIKQKSRLSGIGGETVTNLVALILVCFGQRPGMVRAAVLEDTPNAPFLLPLPIPKASETSVRLSQNSMHFQATKSLGKNVTGFHAAAAKWCNFWENQMLQECY